MSFPTQNPSRARQQEGQLRASKPTAIPLPFTGRGLPVFTGHGAEFVGGQFKPAGDRAAIAGKAGYIIRGVEEAKTDLTRLRPSGYLSAFSATRTLRWRVAQATTVHLIFVHHLRDLLQFCLPRSRDALTITSTASTKTMNMTGRQTCRDIDPC
jgi:hypothetical protein